MWISTGFLLFYVPGIPRWRYIQVFEEVRTDAGIDFLVSRVFSGREIAKHSVQYEQIVLIYFSDYALPGKSVELFLSDGPWMIDSDVMTCMCLRHDWDSSLKHSDISFAEGNPSYTDPPKHFYAYRVSVKDRTKAAL